MSEIRVRNDTGQGFDTVRASLVGVGQPLLWGPLPPGAVTDWQAVDQVQRYPAIEATGPGTDLVHLPYEGEGQAMLADGRYTYVLRIESERLVVGLEPEA